MNKEHIEQLAKKHFTEGEPIELHQVLSFAKEYSKLNIEHLIGKGEVVEKWEHDKVKGSRTIALNAAKRRGVKIKELEAQLQTPAKVTDEQIEKIKYVLKYFDNGLSDVAEGSGEEQPIHKEVKEILGFKWMREQLTKKSWEEKK